MYTDYEYYVNEYLLGKSPLISEDDFPYFEKQARSEIDKYTFGRISRDNRLVSEKVKDCTCAIAELLYMADRLSEQAFQEGAAGPLSSFSNDGQSGTYDLSQSAYTESGKKAKVKQLIYKYLGDTGLLYSGI